MTLLDQITVLILTYNEEANIQRSLDQVKWAKRIVVVDSGSTDSTLDIVRNYPQVEVMTRKFDNHCAQWNFGIAVCGDSTRWILALDADYVLDNAFTEELSGLDPPSDISGYFADFRYLVRGKALSASLYPPSIVLYRRAVAHYSQFGHTQRLIVSGKVGRLVTKISHDDRKSLARWFTSQQKYAALEAAYLMAPRTVLRTTDRIRRWGWLAPILVFFYSLIVKKCAFDGWSGWLYVLQRTLAEVMIAIEIVDRRLGQRGN